MMGSGYKPLPVFYHDTPCKAAPSWFDLIPEQMLVSPMRNVQFERETG